MLKIFRDVDSNGFNENVGKLFDAWKTDMREEDGNRSYAVARVSTELKKRFHPAEVHIASTIAYELVSVEEISVE